VISDIEPFTLWGNRLCRLPDVVVSACREACAAVMMVTAYGDDERRRRADEYGASEFITKPVDFDLLKQRLGQLSPDSMAIERSEWPSISSRASPIRRVARSL
jgi:DNA-binding response OmpR family regulator